MFVSRFKVEIFDYYVTIPRSSSFQTFILWKLFVYILIYFCRSDARVEAMLAQLSTEELLRMLELLDMIESKTPIQASERELAILQYLLKNYQN